jgi:hypothetical protein
MPFTYPADRLHREHYGGFAARLAIIILRGGIADTRKIEILKCAFGLVADAGLISPKMPVMDLRFDVSLLVLRR